MKDPVLNPVHPGDLRLEDFLKPMGISQYRLAKDILKAIGRWDWAVPFLRGAADARRCLQCQMPAKSA